MSNDIDHNKYSTPEFIERHSLNPIFTPKDVPWDSALVFNPAVVKWQDRYVMVFRSDGGNYDQRKMDGTCKLGIAFSDDGLHFTPRPEPCFTHKDLPFAERYGICQVYDPRITILEGKCYLTFAMHSRYGVFSGLAVTEDFKHFELVSTTLPEDRNTVLFDQKFGDDYVRLDRPFPLYSKGGEFFEIWMTRSKDLIHWGRPQIVLGTDEVPFSNLKIGPGAPPIKTKAGWLMIYHAVDMDSSRPKIGWNSDWQKRYMGAVALLDLNDPSRVIGLAKRPLIVPEMDYEFEGFRGNTIFPTAAILEDDETVKIYYGSADTCICLATAKINDLIEFAQL